MGFTDDERAENIRRVAEVAKLFSECGIITLCSFVSPTNKIRQTARDIIGEEKFHEVFVNASFDACSERDVKGLYQKALRGEIKNFTGLDAPFETPENPFLEIDTEENDIEKSLTKFYNGVIKLIKKDQ